MWAANSTNEVARQHDSRLKCFTYHLQNSATQKAPTVDTSTGALYYVKLILIKNILSPRNERGCLTKKLNPSVLLQKGKQSNSICCDPFGLKRVFENDLILKSDR